jgi:adenylosuccinate synthase
MQLEVKSENGNFSIVYKSSEAILNLIPSHVLHMDIHLWIGFGIKEHGLLM